MGESYGAWSLEWEKRYLDELGTGRWSLVRTPRRVMLKKYIDTIGQRHDLWVDAAREYAQFLLEEELSKWKS